MVSKTAAYLITDSRYWLQAEEQLDPNWHAIPAGAVDGPKDWIEWLVVSAHLCCTTYQYLDPDYLPGPSQGFQNRDRCSYDFARESSTPQFKVDQPVVQAGLSASKSC